MTTNELEGTQDLMSENEESSDGATRVAYILGVPLADDVVRQWPQMGEIVRTSKLVADVEGNFPELTLEVGRRLQLDDVVVVEWTCNYGDGRLYRNVTIGELDDGQAVKVTDYWGEPTTTPEWRQPLTDQLEMPGEGIWPDNEHLAHYWKGPAGPRNVAAVSLDHGSGRCWNLPEESRVHV